MDVALRVRCADCHTKWFFMDHHLQRADVDPTTCEACGGELVPVEEAPDAGAEPSA